MVFYNSRAVGVYAPYSRRGSSSYIYDVFHNKHMYSNRRTSIWLAAHEDLCQSSLKNGASTISSFHCFFRPWSQILVHPQPHGLELGLSRLRHQPLVVLAQS